MMYCLYGTGGIIGMEYEEKKARKKKSAAATAATAGGKVSGAEGRSSAADDHLGPGWETVGGGASGSQAKAAGAMR